jgi:hypothetical protein
MACFAVASSKDVPPGAIRMRSSDRPMPLSTVKNVSACTSSMVGLVLPLEAPKPAIVWCRVARSI